MRVGKANSKLIFIAWKRFAASDLAYAPAALLLLQFILYNFEKSVQFQRRWKTSVNFISSYILVDERTSRYEVPHVHFLSWNT